MMPAVPGIVSRMIAAMVAGPSKLITCSRCASARWHSSASVLEWNGERYRNGPKKCTAPAAPRSFGQRRGSPVRFTAVWVPPW